MRVELVALLLAAAGLFVSGCNDASNRNEKSAAAAKPSAGQHVTPPSAATPEQLTAPKFKVDGKRLDVGPLGEELELLSIQSLPVIDDWKTVIVRSADGREFRGAQPKRLTGKFTMRLVWQEAGFYEFRVMQPGTGARSIRHKMSEVELISIHTLAYTPPRPSAEPIVVVGADQERALSESVLAATERAPEPGQREQRDTWFLGDLMTRPIEPEAKGLLLRTHEDKQLLISGTELSDKAKVHIIKRNRRGQFHYRAWQRSDPPSKQIELRYLKTIEIL